MFAARYWTPRYWAVRYWPKVGAISVIPATPVLAYATIGLPSSTVTLNQAP